MAVLMAAGKYDNYFVQTPPDHLVCKICHLLSRDPYLSVCCGHIFCKNCLDDFKKSAAITNACPVCHNEEFVTFPNKAAGREIQNLHIYCTNKEKGCEWEGKLNDINNHLGNNDGCWFEGVKCSSRCGKMIQRQYLTSHVENECPRRTINCQYCHTIGEHQYIEGQHKEDCPKLPLPCPNNCEVGSVPREDMEAHRKECPLEMIQCEYHNVGCKVRMVRKDYEKHKKENMEEHLLMTTHKVSRVDDVHHELTDMKVELTNTKSELSDTKAQLATALEQINNLTILVNSQLSSTAMSTKRIRSVQLDSMVKMHNIGHQVCPVTIKMSGYNSKMKNSIEWYSDPFYTHNKGYQMCLRIDAAGFGTGKGTHLSAYLYLMKGPHDDELKWPLRGSLKIKLLNQISDNSHHVTKVVYDDSTKDDDAGRVTRSNRVHGRGRNQFISNENLYKVTPHCQYLKSDCLFFQVTTR